MSKEQKEINSINRRKQTLQQARNDIIRLIKAIAVSLNNLHNQGYVYLDLKPENIFIYPETPEMIMLFDFDSAIKKENIFVIYALKTVYLCDTINPWFP